LAAHKTIEEMKMVPLQIPAGKLVIKRGFY